MAGEQDVRALAGTISGTRILGIAQELSRLHRVPGSPGFSDAVDVVLRALAGAGVTATVHEYPADGVSKTYEWTAPPAWTVRAGTLWEVGATLRAIVDFAEVAQGVVVHSPGGAFEGEVVPLGAPASEADYDGADLAGKVALVCARASEAVARAARRGAVGVIVYPDDERAAVSHDLVQYQSLFPRREAIPGLVPAFSVSRRAADRLTRAAAKRAVVVRGEIDAEFIARPLQVIEAHVPGSAQAGSVLFTAHLCHPRGSANDNASGAAALAEIARALRAQPARLAGRFLWMPEFYGSLPWAAERAGRLGDVECVLNLDMVGASPERIGEPLRVFRPANHTPHYVSALVEPLAAAVATCQESVSARGSRRPLHWSFDLPSGGSDHVVLAASPHRLPALMLGHDDPYWHTDFDTVENLDPTRLKQAALLAAGLAAAAAPEGETAEWVWDRLYAHSVCELARAREVGRALDPGPAGRLLDLALEIETRRSATLRVVGPARQAARAAALRAARDELGAGLPTEQRPADGGAPRPRRQVDGPLVYTVAERFSEEDAAFFKDRFSANHRAPAEGLLNHCDGTKTPRDIALLLSLDAGGLMSVEDVERGIGLCRKAGYVA